jgi:hypothetical protein
MSAESAGPFTVIETVSKNTEKFAKIVRSFEELFLSIRAKTAILPVSELAGTAQIRQRAPFYKYWNTRV